MESAFDKAPFMFTNEGSFFSGRNNQASILDQTPQLILAAAKSSPVCAQASNRHSQAARGAGKNKLIFQAGFLKLLERNIYISNQNISLLRRAVYQNEHFHSLADRPAEMLLFYECAKSSMDLFQCPC